MSKDNEGLVTWSEKRIPIKDLNAITLISNPDTTTWTAMCVGGNPFRAAFAINMFLWSLGIFEGWGE